MAVRDWAERQFWGRAAFTLAFFVVAVALFFHYRILYGPLLFPGYPFLSITVPALAVALVAAFVARRLV